MASENGSQQTYDPAALGQTLGTKLTQVANTPAPYGGVGATTRSGMEQLLSSAQVPGYADSVKGAIGSFGRVATGADRGGANPEFERNLERTISDTKGDVLASLGASGGLNSDLHIKTLSEALGGVRDRAFTDERQYQDGRQMAAASALPGMFEAYQMPARTALTVGQAQDIDADKVANNERYRLFELLGAFNGTSANPGMTEEIPWWEQGLGYAAQLGGTALGTMARGGF